MQSKFRPTATATLVLGSLAVLMTLWLGQQNTTQAAPEPDVVSRSWSFDFTNDKPKPIAVRNLDGETEWYWYLPYKVTNNTDRERLWVPEIVVSTDHGHVLVANQKIPPSVFRAIKDREANPLLESPVAVVGRLLLGEDHAKESVAVWPHFEQPIDELHVFISGISGETKVFKDPQTGEEIRLRKTLHLSYDLPGEPQTPRKQTVLVNPRRWVMR